MRVDLHIYHYITPSPIIQKRVKTRTISPQKWNVYDLIFLSKLQLVEREREGKRDINEKFFKNDQLERV